MDDILPDPTFGRYLSQALRQMTLSPDPSGATLLGSGAAQKAAGLVDARQRDAYNQYATEAASQGAPVVPYAQWVAQQQQQRTTMPATLR